VLSSSLDLSLRGVDDALSTLSAVSDLQRDAIQSLIIEGRLLRETDCLVARIVHAQEKRRAEFVSNLTEIERRAAESAASLSARSDKLTGAVKTAYEIIRVAIAEHIVGEVKTLRVEAENELKNLVDTLNTYKSSAGQLQEQVDNELTELETASCKMAKSTVLAAANSKEFIAERCDQMEQLMHELDSIKSKVALAVEDLRVMPLVQEEIGTTAENMSKEISRRKQAVTEAVHSYADNVAKKTDNTTKTVLALKSDIILRGSSLEQSAYACIDQVNSQINECAKEICSTFDQSIKVTTRHLPCP
ncbi:hypothetical protein BIW11_10076, partial [Tropilaelaps mercedesae]